MLAHYNFDLSDKSIHIGACGSISAYKSIDILRNLKKAGATCSVTLTPSASKFVLPLTFSSLGAEIVYSSMFDDLNAPSPFAHLEPGQNSQVMIIAPASASTISRIAHGMADELLACQALAFKGKVVVAPAMNPNMWNNLATQENIEILKRRGISIIEPGWGVAACGDYGQGRLADLEDVHLGILYELFEKDLQGKKVMITLGPTREHFDGLRYATNPSSGLMGACLAMAAWLRGADVTAICGPMNLSLPPQIKQYKVVSASEMYEAANDVWADSDIGIFTAAVADFKPDTLASGKFKKQDAKDGFNLNFTPTIDILASLGKNKKEHQKIVGFAAESQDLELAVQKKLISKNADLLVGNLLKDGFATQTNSVLISDRTGKMASYNDLAKTELAWRIISWLNLL